jgi:hypothetical protein
MIYRFAKTLVTASPDEAVVRTPDGKEFLYTREMVESHLAEGWAWDESTFCTVELTDLEMFPRDYRYLLAMMNELRDKE